LLDLDKKNIEIKSLFSI